MILLLVLASFTLLAAGTYRQSQLLFGRAPPKPRRAVLLGGGYALLIASLVLQLGGGDVPRHLVTWFGDLSVAALLVVSGFWIATARRG